MKRISLTLLALGALLAAGCSNRLIVGVVMPESGVNRGYGQALEAGAKLVFDDAVAKQSPPGFQARYRDSLSHPEYAAQEARELYNEGAWIVIGGATSAEAKAMIPEANKAKRVLLSPSASEPDLAASSNLFFRVYPSDDVEAKIAASFLVTHRKARKILVLYQSGVYGEGMLKAFTASTTSLGGKIEKELPIGPTDWDKTIGEAVKSDKPDGIFIGAYADEAVAALNVIRGAQYEGTVCASSALALGDVIARAGSVVEGVFVPTIRVDLASQKEPVKSFVDRYKKAHNGAMPDLFAAFAYDAATVAVNALQGQPPKDTSELLVRIMSQGGKQGVTGKLGFDAEGNTVNGPRMYCIRNGKFEDCDPWPLP
jgi:branched-chain amino acid transport system substrate-binding protein